MGLHGAGQTWALGQHWKSRTAFRGGKEVLRWPPVLVAENSNYTAGCLSNVMLCSAHHYNPEMTLPAFYVHQWWPAAVRTALT